MAVSCNINRQGRTLRIVAGAMLEGPGFVLLVLRFTGVLTGDWPWFVGAAAVVGGSFMIIEGALGWCAIRALGIKTPI